MSRYCHTGGVCKKNQFDVAFPKGQLKEHVLLCKGSGIDNIIADVKNMDLVGWSSRSFDFIKKLRRYLKSFGFSGLFLSFIPSSSEPSQNVFDPYHAECSGMHL